MKQKIYLLTKQFWNWFSSSFLPNKNDNTNQIITKIIYLASLVLIIAFFLFVVIYFACTGGQKESPTQNKQTFSAHSTDNDTAKELKYLKKKNADFRCWIEIEDTDISSPVYQAKDNDYYKTHNQFKRKNKIGALHFDCTDDLNGNDQNIIIYGKNEPELFEDLEKYSSISYFQEHPIIELSTPEKTTNYIILGAFIINSKAEDDNGYVFDFKKSNFDFSTVYYNWYTELTQRFLYTCHIPVDNKDSFLTLVTESDEFEDAQFVLIARKIRSDEIISRLTAIKNENPRYPQKYYDVKGIISPFNKEENHVS